MGHFTTLKAACAACAFLIAPSNLAAQESAAREVYISPVTANAANIRKLNIMLMVTSLRCRQTVHDFQSEYDLFATAHQHNLAEAHQALIEEMVALHGEAGSDRALDRIGVSIANRYGEGHPTLGCLDLKNVTLQLAMSQDRVRLSQMANDLLGNEIGSPLPAGSEGNGPNAQPKIRPEFGPAPRIPHYSRG